MLNGLDLFSGIGGGAFALAPWVRPIAYCEVDESAQGILLENQQRGEIPIAPIWDDIRTLTSEHISAEVDIIYGGFPCQDISVAGRGAGLGGQRSGLFFEIIRLAQEIEPVFVFLENVPAIRTRGAARIIEEFSKLGYDCRWAPLSAQEVGAHHKRNRWWLLATHSERLQLRIKPRGRCRQDREGPAFPRNDGTEKPLANGNGKRLEIGIERDAGELPAALGGSGWAIEPDVGRVAHGVSSRVDRIKGLGNAWVPLQAREAFRRLMGL